MGINPNNKITIIIRMLFAVTLFQQCNIPDIKSMQNKNKMLEMAE
jgi:hypothetical protein